MRLGKRQKEIIELMKDNPGSFFIYHRKYNGKKCFRLMSCEMSPIKNIKTSRVIKLLTKGLLFEDFKKRFHLKRTP